MGSDCELANHCFLAYFTLLLAGTYPLRNFTPAGMIDNRSDQSKPDQAFSSFNDDIFRWARLPTE